MIATLLVHLELDRDNEGLLKVAGDLAQRFKAGVIGIAACQPIQPLYEEGPVSAEVMTEDRAEIAKEIAAVERQFRSALAGRAAFLQWRSVITYGSLADFIASEARAADLILTGRDLGLSLLDNSRRVNIGDLVLRAGRPVLIVPQGISTLALKNVFIGWKDSRETRRAAADALPLLRPAENVTVLQVSSFQDSAEADARVKDVAEWLRRHGVEAAHRVLTATDIEAVSLRNALIERKCDLLIAGAYGHNRLGEWVFGGVTADLLLDPDFCVLVSH